MFFHINLITFLNIILLIISFNLVAKTLLSNNNEYKKSYCGSILSGQIANYNNDSSISADFFNYAHTINPKNNEVYKLSLMSLIISGNVELAISTVKKYDSIWYTNE